MRWLIAFSIVLVGCVASMPRDDAAITADIAAETAREVIRLRHAVTPTPTPPAPDDKCLNCDGRGFVGDGTVQVKCQPCNGTGKR